MTTRLKGFVVTLAENIREDEAEPVVAAVRMIKGVLAVDPIPANADDWIIDTRIRIEFQRRLFDLVNGKAEAPR